ncbi:MAG: dTDP-4-dehydrorhamnose 3,5-epimerase [Solirubrobacteraceae bacterium]|nr:dTDP-4-dehydrorhamnose 3,5-epimerase [Solirubrobacteraceae bacterium]
MQQIATRLEGPVVLEPLVHGDERGFFVESFRESTMAELGIDDHFVQENHSRSAYGVVRGMHFQNDPPSAKLVRCARGAIVDVVVDIRPGSRTFGQWEAFELDDRAMRIVYVPAGFAHGFAVVSEVADVLYKQTAYWRADADLGFALDDPDVGIEWPIPPEARIVSARDREAPSLPELATATSG